MSLAVQNLPTNEGVQVWFLVWEDPTCHGATKPVHHNYRTCALEPASCNFWAHTPPRLKPEHPRACAPQRDAHAPQLESSPHSLLLEKAEHSNQDPVQPKINKYSLKCEFGIREKISNLVFFWRFAEYKKTRKC